MLPNYFIHHIAIAVKDLDSAVKSYKEQFPCIELPRETVTEFGAEVAFLLPHNAPAGTTAIELISPLPDCASDSGLKKFLEKKGEGLHHICYEVSDITAEHKRLSTLGLNFIDQAPRPGAHQSLVMFLHPKSANGVLVELRQGHGSN
ncbi:MAG: methylmalonyl-CoA epimerase [Bdellovibrionales bacterium]|nr:methylmalonyl-CoA epimerase [Bdellovibrionales bacterium]